MNKKQKKSIDPNYRGSSIDDRVICNTGCPVKRCDTVCTIYDPVSGDRL